MLFLLLIAAPAEDAAGIEHFEKKVRPILAEVCSKCHGDPEKMKGGLLLTSRQSILEGGDSGPALVPGDPDKSLIVLAVRQENDLGLKMPPRGKLEASRIADIERWVAMGAPWPASAAPAPGEAASERGFDLDRRRSEHWAWRPIAAAEPPPVRDAEWPKSPIDYYILSKLEENGLRPAPEASKRELLRRAAFDIAGLPPAQAEIEAFLADVSPGAYERMVDRLLDSPRFGERWARHWLDLMRYAETLGHEFDYAVPNAWRYRDYVIRAFNADVPHDRFLEEHLIGDLLENPRRHPAEKFNESIIGTGFYWLGQQTHSPVDVLRHGADVLENQIDVLSKAFLGLTVACARCHDHKFDAISTRDYYSLQSVLSSSRYRQAAIDPPQRIGAAVEKLLDLRRRMREAAGPALAASAAGSTAGSPGPAAPPQGDGGPEGEYSTLADFRAASPAEHGWFPEGEAFAFDPAGAGEFLVEGTENEPSLLPLRRGWVHSDLLSRRLEGALRSPTFAIERGFIHARVLGSESRINAVVSGYTLIRDPIYGGLKKILRNPSPHWVTFDVRMWKGQRAYLEFLDISAPDPADGRNRYPAEGYIAVERVVLSDRGSPPPDGGGSPEPASLAAEEGGPLAALIGEYRRVEAAIPEPTRVPAITEGSGEDGRIYIRGNPRNPGDPAPRSFLTAIAGPEQPPVERGSGRRELARRLLDPANPFPARVWVNFVWSKLLGRGLVASPDDLGFLGERPTHPELLDHLAAEFRRDGWSTKRLIRRILLSSTYRMSSAAAGPAAEERDPDNRLLHRARVRRLEGEAIRDAMLAVSGGLNPEMFGPPVPVHLTPFMEGRGRPGRSGPVDGAGRRSIYLEVRRNFLAPMFLAFDAPIPHTTVGRRTVSNVPAQALILMNDPFVAGEASRWARRVLEKGPAEPRQRIALMYIAALGRPPEEGELSGALAFLDEQGRAHGLPESRRLEDEKVWTDFAHVLFNVKEFIYIR